MKTQFSAVELLAMSLPGLPSSEKGLRLRADRESWSFSEVPGKGGRNGTRREYLLSGLPVDLRQAIQKTALDAAVEGAASVVARHDATALKPTGEAQPMKLSATPVVPFSDLTDKQRLERDARTGVLAAVRRLQSASSCTQEAALTTLLTSARAGRLDEATDRLLRLARDPRGRAGDGYPSVRTLKRWLTAADLAPKTTHADMSVPAWAGVFLTVWRKPEKPSVEAAYRDACDVWPAGERPSIHQVRRFLSKLGNVTREAGRMGARELKNIQPFVRRDFSLLEPNDVWSADGHTFDAEVQHPMHGRPFRPEITVFVDIATRKAVGWSVDLAESSNAVADALRWGVERNGVPALIYVDNGSGYRNAMMNDEALGLVGRIGSTMTHSLPYNSQARGVIERLHQTLWTTGAQLLPGFIGAAMDREARLAQFRLSRKSIKGGGAMPLMPWELFCQWVQERVDWYNAKAHRSLGNSSPDMVWRAFEAKGWEQHMLPAEVLETLFRPRVSRTVARGELTLFNNRYFARALEEFHGEIIHVAYDIHNVGAVWAYWPDGRLICTAEVNGNSKHYFPVPVVEQARQKRAKGRLAKVEVKREEILAELHGTGAIPMTLEAGPLVIGGRIVQPEAVLAARHAAVADASEVAAATPKDMPQIKPKPEPKGAAVPSRSDRSAADNFADWAALDQRITNGEEVTEADTRWHRTYPNSAQYKAHLKKLAASAATRAA